jgi:hypothetical protein
MYSEMSCRQFIMWRDPAKHKFCNNPRSGPAPRPEREPSRPRLSRGPVGVDKLRDRTRDLETIPERTSCCQVRRRRMLDIILREGAAPPRTCRAMSQTKGLDGTKRMRLADIVSGVPKDKRHSKRASRVILILRSFVRAASAEATLPT